MCGAVRAALSSLPGLSTLQENPACWFNWSYPCPCCQVDILSSATEVDEVVSFVRSNAARVLGVDEPQVLPVRCALPSWLASVWAEWQLPRSSKAAFDIARPVVQIGC